MISITNLARIISLERKHLRRRVKVPLELNGDPEVVGQSRISLVGDNILGQIVVGILPLETNI